MKSFLIVCKNKKNARDLKSTITRLGFNYDSKSPDMVISLGGDGTYLYSERIYPGVPKLLIRDSNICNKCENLKFDELFMKIALKSFVVVENIKLEAVFKNKKYTATNDFVLRNMAPLYALRFDLFINNKHIDLLIGDGVVVSTPFGSSAYHYSITKTKFNQGIGVAFNNVTKKQQHLVMDENAVIKIKIIRHKAHFAMDNNPIILKLKEGDEITIKKSPKVAKLIKII